MHICNLAAEEIADAVGIITRIYPTTDAEAVRDDLRAMFELKHCAPTYLIARVHGRIVGLAGYTEQTSVDRNIASMHSVSVPPEYQRQGVSRSLIAEIIRRCRAKQRAHLLQVTTAEPDYYMQFGFLVKEVFGPERRCLMTLNVACVI